MGGDIAMPVVSHISAALLVCVAAVSCVDVSPAQVVQNPEVALVVSSSTYTPSPRPPLLSVTPGGLRLEWNESDAIVCDTFQIALDKDRNHLVLRVSARRREAHQESEDCGVIVITKHFEANVSSLPAGTYRLSLLFEKTLADTTQAHVVGTWDQVRVPPP